MVELKLLIMGGDDKNHRNLTNLREAYKQRGVSECSFDIVDLLDNPEAADKYKIFATPTLLKIKPLPVVRVIGDLTDHDRVIDALGEA